MQQCVLILVQHPQYITLTAQLCQVTGTGECSVFCIHQVFLQLINLQHILLALIAAANINNTISTGVLLRRREFAMYKSVGMAEDGFGKMIRLETFLYGIRALMIGIPVSILISYVMFRAFDAELYSFNIDWIMYILVIVVVFAIVGASMLLSVNKLKGDSIIEALKNEMV